MKRKKIPFNSKMKNRDNFLNSFKKYNLQEDFKSYYQLRNKDNREISMAKADYFSIKVEENKYDSKTTMATA